MDNLINFDDLESALEEFNTVSGDSADKIMDAHMSEEMKAAQKRYEEYIVKHTEE